MHIESYIVCSNAEPTQKRTYIKFITLRTACGGFFISLHSGGRVTFLSASVLALVFSCLFTWVPGLNRISGGLAIVICTVLAVVVAVLVIVVCKKKKTVPAEEITEGSAE